jgi:hypothetical protein
MNTVGYIALDPTPQEMLDLKIPSHVVLEPGPVFRDQDMYLELRALDYFGEDAANRRSLRIGLRQRAEDFAARATKAAKSPR